MSTTATPAPQSAPVSPAALSRFSRLSYGSPGNHLAMASDSLEEAKIARDALRLLQRPRRAPHVTDVGGIAICRRQMRLNSRAWLAHTRAFTRAMEAV